MKKLLLIVCLMLCGQAYSQPNLVPLGYLSYGSATVAGVWHYVDSLNNEYALVGASDRVSIVNVNDPANPTEVFSVPALSGQTSLWRELKTYGKYAYAVSEGGGGVIVIDLSHLPASISSTHWYGDGAIAGQLHSAHTIAATDGYLYIFGSNVLGGGALIASIADPANPVYVGNYGTNYIHDGYIRNDTLWGGEIYAGQFSVIDVSDKSNPVLLATQLTPGRFTHNTWLSDNSKYLFTTDEKNNQPLGSFDITDLNNIQLIYSYFTDSMPDEEVHNVRVLDDYLIAPSYGSQLTVCDAAHPDNIVEIGDFPTGQFLCWDADPYLPSGNIIVTDTYSGFFVFSMNYKRACYLEGTIRDSVTNNVIYNASVKILNTPKSTASSLAGIYKTGIADAGTYDIEYSKTGYITRIFQNVSLSNGQLTQMDIKLLQFTASGNVTELNGGATIQNALVTATASNGNMVQVSSDINGAFTLPAIASGTYQVEVSKWGYASICTSILVDGTAPLQFQLGKGYSDSFSADEGWTVSATATSGAWTRAIPVETLNGSVAANPGTDAADDCGGVAYVTGNGGGNQTFDDLDNGNTELTSPAFDLSAYSDPYVSYDYWLFMPPGIPANSVDTLFVRLTNGITTATIDAFTLSSPLSSWNKSSKRISDFITPTVNMHLKVFIEDKPGGQNVLEAGFDNFKITDGATGVPEHESDQAFIAYPNPFSNEITLKINQSTDLSGMALKVTDVTGRLVLSQDVNQHSFKIAGSATLSNGLYSISLMKQNNTMQVLKVIKAN